MLSIESLPHEEQLAISSAKVLSSWCWSCDFSDQVTSEVRDNRTAVTQRLLKMFDDEEVRVLLLFVEWLWYNYLWCRNFYWLGLENGWNGKVSRSPNYMCWSFSSSSNLGYSLMPAIFNNLLFLDVNKQWFWTLVPYSVEVSFSSLL